MANCDISKGRRLGCSPGAAGLLSIFFLNTGFTVTYDAQGELITDIQLTAGGAVTFYKWELDNDGNNFTENLEKDRNNGSYFYAQVLTLALQNLAEQDVVEVNQLAKGRPAAVVHYRNGKARLAGASRGFDTSGNNTSGGALGDFQGNNLTLTANEAEFAHFLEGATKEDPFAGLTTEPTIVSGTS